MTFFDYYASAFKKYAVFNGRARRSEYWYFMLFQVIALAALQAFEGILGLPVFSGIFALVSIIPSFAVFIRRLHDTGRSGWWFLVVLIPFGTIVLLVFMIRSGERGDNKYGPDPKRTPFDGDDIARHLVE